MGPFLREYLSRHEDIDDDDDEMGHLYTGLDDIRVLARTMTTTTRGRLSLRVIRDGRENVFRPRTQQEIPTKFKRLNSRARICRA